MLSMEEIDVKVPKKKKRKGKKRHISYAPKKSDKAPLQSYSQFHSNNYGWELNLYLHVRAQNVKATSSSRKLLDNNILL